MKFAILTAFLISLSWQVTAQTIAAIASSICDSINSLDTLSESDMKAAQLRIYRHELTKYPTLKVDITGLNRPRQFNEFNYKINRELLKTCPPFKDQFSFLPLSKILDVEGLFTQVQYDSLERSIVDFINQKKIDLVIVTIDDVFPFENIEDFVRLQSVNWKIGNRYEEGGILLVISKNLNDLSFSINRKNERPFSALDFQTMINEIGSPEFKKGNYFKGLYYCINYLKSEL